jgi:hypothetical protein
MNSSNDGDNPYSEHQLLALAVLQEELTIILSFMDATGLTAVEQGAYKSLSVITEILKQKQKRASLRIRKEIDNVVEVDFNTKTHTQGTSDDG